LRCEGKIIPVDKEEEELRRILEREWEREGGSGVWD
jgi:hypothetical protein